MGIDQLNDSVRIVRLRIRHHVDACQTRRWQPPLNLSIKIQTSDAPGLVSQLAFRDETNAHYEVRRVADGAHAMTPQLTLFAGGSRDCS